MISLLTGVGAGMEDDGRVVVDVAGVGYGVVVHDRDRAVVNARGIGGTVRLFVRTIATEHATTLYGFLDPDDRRAFDRLRDVDGVGPAAALKLLSAMTADQLRRAVASRDPKALRVPGVGPKTSLKLLEAQL